MTIRHDLVTGFVCGLLQAAPIAPAQRPVGVDIRDSTVAVALRQYWHERMSLMNQMLCLHGHVDSTSVVHTVVIDSVVAGLRCPTRPTIIGMLVVLYPGGSPGRRENRIAYYRQKLEESPYWFILGILVGID